MKKARFKISPQTFGVMVSRMLLDYEVEPVLTLADRSGEQEYVVPGGNVVSAPASSLVTPEGKPVGPTSGEAQAAEGHEGRKFRRAPLEFMGMPLKIWEELK